MSVPPPSTRSFRPVLPTRTSLVALSLILVGSILLTSCSSASTDPTTTSPAATRADFLASAFLNRYAAPDGRVIRYDQGSDTVSEGQGYGLLLAVATHDASRFASIWNWTKDNLQEPDGLFDYRWANGAVVGNGPATDADLDTAWALVLGARRFHKPAYLQDGLVVAKGILANETVVAGGHIELVGGPWARNAPYPVDPSYFSPEAMAALAAASGNHVWTNLEANSEQLVRDLQGNGFTRSLPPDWALLSTSGTIRASPPPAGGGPAAYGLDAERVPVWYAADCTASGRALSAEDWAIISGLAASGSYHSYSLKGAVLVTYTNNLGIVASAASADADGNLSRGRELLAQSQTNLGLTYYGDAWVALGAVLLTTDLLSPCPPDPSG
jgi:endoglucanase